MGIPASALRLAGYWKEAVIAALVLAAIGEWRSTRHRVDGLDVACIAYMLVVGFYYLFPHAFTYAGLPPVSGVARQLGLREDALFVLAFLSARHARLGADWAERATRPLLTVGAIVAALGIFEYLAPGTWSHLVVNTFRVPAYNSQVLKSSGQVQVESFASAGGRSVLRIGSVLLNPIVLGPWLLVPLALGLERMARGIGRMATAISVALVGAALILTQTRSSVLGGIIIVFLVALRAPERSAVRRTRFALVAGVLLLLAIPLSMGVGLTTRTSSAVSGTDQSTQGHLKSFTTGINDIIATPLGRGLGTAPGAGTRTDAYGRVTSENYYLQVGDELGVFALIPFVLLTGLMLRRLFRSQRAGPGGALSGAMWTSGVGLALGAFLLHVWAGFVVALTFWPLAGAVIGIADAERTESGSSARLPAPPPEPSQADIDADEDRVLAPTLSG
jgi:hypothetical protein